MAKKTKTSTRGLVKKVHSRYHIGRMPESNFKKWLVKYLKRKGVPSETRRIQQYVQIYNRAKQLTPQMIDFVETIFVKRKNNKVGRQLIFLGRGSRPFYRIAKRLAVYRNVPTEKITLMESIKLIEAGRRLSGKSYNDPEIRKKLFDYMKTKGIDFNKSITFIDTGVIGTVPNDFIQMFKKAGFKTRVNGYMFYGRNVRTKDVTHYSPSGRIKWTLPEFSEREARSLIEELPKSTLTIKELITTENGTRPKYQRSDLEERIGATVVRKAILEIISEYQKRIKK